MAKKKKEIKKHMKKIGSLMEKHLNKDEKEMKKDYKKEKKEHKDLKKETNKERGKVAKVMHEFKEGKLDIGKSDKPVTNPKQAIAIAMSEAKIAKKKKKKK